jgi:hypothetical protein
MQPRRSKRQRRPHLFHDERPLDAMQVIKTLPTLQTWRWRQEPTFADYAKTWTEIVEKK